MSESHSVRNTDDRVAVIDRWMQMVLDTQGVERFDDLHIDRIDPEWKGRDTWINGSSESLKLARKSRQCIAPDKVLALMCSLICGPDEILPASLDDLASQIDCSPPSLYLFERGSEPWIKTEGLTLSPLSELFSDCTCLLMEYQPSLGTERSRSFVAVA